MSYLVSQFELSSKNEGKNVLSMEGMRGFAVFLVFLLHYAGLNAPWIGQVPYHGCLLRHSTPFGNAGIDLFFVLPFSLARLAPRANVEAIVKC